MLLKLEDVRQCDIKKYDELSVKNLYDQFMKLEGVKKYFPSRHPKGRFCCRTYMFNVVSTLHNDVVKKLIHHALEQRHAIDSENKRDEAIMMSEHWRSELRSLPMNTTVSFFY